MIKKRQKERRIGYARVSTREQNLDMQIEGLKADGVLDDDLHVEKVSASARTRKVLNWCISTLRPGDVLVVWKLDRLSRSVVQMHHLANKIKDIGASLHSLTETVETESPHGMLFFNIMASMAQLERDNTRFRTRKGIETAKRKGTRFGQKPKLTEDQVHQCHEWRFKDGISIRDIEKRVKEKYKKTVSYQTVLVWTNKRQEQIKAEKAKAKQKRKRAVKRKKR